MANGKTSVSCCVKPHSKTTASPLMRVHPAMIDGFGKRSQRWANHYLAYDARAVNRVSTMEAESGEGMSFVYVAK